MQHAEKPAAEAIAEGQRRLRLEVERRIVEPQLPCLHKLQRRGCCKHLVHGADAKARLYLVPRLMFAIAQTVSLSQDRLAVPGYQHGAGKVARGSIPIQLLSHGRDQFALVQMRQRELGRTWNRHEADTDDLVRLGALNFQSESSELIRIPFLQQQGDLRV